MYTIGNAALVFGNAALVLGNTALASTLFETLVYRRKRALPAQPVWLSWPAHPTIGRQAVAACIIRAYTKRRVRACTRARRAMDRRKGAAEAVEVGGTRSSAGAAGARARRAMRARAWPYRNPSSEGAGALVRGARSQETVSWWVRLIMTGDRILEQGRHQECVRQMFSVVGRERAITDAWPHAPHCKRARSLRSAAMMEVCAISSPASICRFLASFSRQPEGLLEADWVARKRSINFPSFIRSSWSGNALIARQARFQRVRPYSKWLAKPSVSILGQWTERRSSQCCIQPR